MSDEPTFPPPSELLDFSEQVVLVTGAGRGIGAGIALRFAQAGAAVIVNYRSSAEGANTVVSDIKALGRRAIALAADVSKRSEVERLVEQSVDQLGGLDVLINNAGSYPQSTLVEMSEEDWQGVIDSNLKSVFLCTQAAARYWIKKGANGAVVNIGSIEGSGPAPAHSHYNSAKAAVLMHTRAAAQELGRNGIRVNSVSPGLIWREGLEEAWPEGVDKWMANVPLGRMGRADDIGDACLFLASSGARWISGVDLPVDGGILSRPVV